VFDENELVISVSGRVGTMTLTPDNLVSLAGSRRSKSGEVRKMTTYREVQNRVREQYGFVPKTCWIAHILSDHNSLTRRAVSLMNVGVRRYPCPDDKRPPIETVLREFHMLRTPPAVVTV
jgi:hypothetical protein